MLWIANYPSLLKQRLLKNKMPSSYTAAESPFAGSTHPERQSRQVDLISFCLTMQQKNVFSDHSLYTYTPTNIYILFDYRFSFCLANLFKADHNTIVWAPRFCWGGFKLVPNFQKREGVTESQFLKGVAWKERVTVFQGVQFPHDLKSEILLLKNS